MVSILYFHFQNYGDAAAVFIDIVSFLFSMKKYKSKSDGIFYRSFPTVFISRSEMVGCDFCFRLMPLLVHMKECAYYAYEFRSFQEDSI